MEINHVDGMLPEWVEESATGCEIEALLVVPCHVERREFDRHVLGADGRRRAAVVLTGAAAARPGRVFGVVDRRASETVSEGLDDGLGPDPFAEEMATAEREVASRLGGVLRAAAALGVTVTPPLAPDAFTIEPARSFRSAAGVAAHARGNRIRWRPSARVRVKVVLDGPHDAVAWSAASVRAALWNCGPVVEMSERTRPAAAGVPAGPGRIRLLDGVAV